MKRNGLDCDRCGMRCQKGAPFQMICGMELSEREREFATELFLTAKSIAELTMPTASLVEMLHAYHHKTYERIINGKLTKKEKLILERVLAAEIQCATTYDTHLLNYSRIKALNERILNNNPTDDIEYF